MPATGLSLFLIAVGAILAFAVTTTVAGISIPAVGVILMIVGILGLMLSFLFLMSFSPFRSDSPSGVAPQQVEHVERVDVHHVD
jgi:xanthosine utilization system XapX-like protein